MSKDIVGWLNGVATWHDKRGHPAQAKQYREAADLITSLREPWIKTADQLPGSYDVLVIYGPRFEDANGTIGVEHGDFVATVRDSIICWMPIPYCPHVAPKG